MFDNPQLQQLPKHSTIDFQPLASKALLSVQLNALLFYVPLAIVFTVICYLNKNFADLAQNYLLVGMPIFVALMLTFNVYGVRAKGVAMRKHDIAYRRGVIWQQVTILPLSRVQHTEIHRGPIERKLGLASIKLYSAGGMSADLQISGLTEEDCNDIRQFVQNYDAAPYAQDDSEHADT